MPSDPKQRAIEEAKARDAVEEKQKQATRMAVGFRRVIDEISEAGKPVIAHNGLLVRASSSPCLSLEKLRFCQLE